MNEMLEFLPYHIARPIIEAYDRYSDKEYYSLGDIYTIEEWGDTRFEYVEFNDYGRYQTHVFRRLNHPEYPSVTVVTSTNKEDANYNKLYFSVKRV